MLRGTLYAATYFNGGGRCFSLQKEVERNRLCRRLGITVARTFVRAYSIIFVNVRHPGRGMLDDTRPGFGGMPGGMATPAERHATSIVISHDTCLEFLTRISDGTPHGQPPYNVMRI